MPIKRWFTLDGLRLLLPMLVMVVVIGIARYGWGYYLSRLRGPVGFTSIEVVCLPFFVVAAVIGGASLYAIVRSLRRTRSAIPMLVLALGTLLVFQVPLPEPPDTPEKLHFLDYRADYEAVVELARNGELEASAPECGTQFRPPQALAHVSGAGCMFVSNLDNRGLVVFFHPLESFYHLVAYVEFDDGEYACGRDPYVEQKIDDHWYVCEYD